MFRSLDPIHDIRKQAEESILITGLQIDNYTEKSDNTTGQHNFRVTNSKKPDYSYKRL